MLIESLPRQGSRRNLVAQPSADEDPMVWTIEIPPSAAPFEVVMAMVDELAREHGAIVTEVDMSTTGGCVTLLIPRGDPAA